MEESRSQALVAAFFAGTAAAVVDCAGRLVEVSARLSELLGLPREQLLLRSFGDLVDGAPEVRLFHQNAIVDSTTPWRDVVPLRRGQSRAFLEIDVSPIPAAPSEERRQLLVVFHEVSRPRTAELEVLRQALEDASQASAQRLQFLFDGVPAMVYSGELGDEVGARSMSPNARSCLGYDPREFLAPGFWRANVHPEDLQAVLAQSEMLRQTKWQSLQYRFRHRDGVYRWMLDECRVVEAGNRPRPRVFGYWMDITERKDAEAALRDSRELLELAQSGAGIGGWQVDLPTGRAELDEAAGKLLGLGRDELSILGSVIEARLHPDDRPAYDRELQRLVLAELALLQIDVRFQHVAGRWLWVRLRGRVVEREADGRPRRVRGTLLDITHRKLVEEAAARAQGAVDAATSGIVIVDAASADHGILYANPAFLRMTGYAWEEVVGRNCRFLQGSDQAQPEVEAIRVALATGTSCQVTLRNYRKDGSLYWNDLTISPVRDADGKLTHFVGIANDITERRQLEEELRQSQKMEAIGQLAGGVAHDFNNLLTVILSSATAMQHFEPLSREMKVEVQSVIAAAERGAELTRQLLAFARRSVKAAERLDFGVLVANMVKLMRRLLGENIEVECSIARELPGLSGDRGMLDQVLINLAVNARDAMPHGGRLRIGVDTVFVDELAARRHREARPGRYLCLRVSDTGSGIPAELLPHVFEPFFTTKEVGKGTGLGLATVYGIVRQHHGWIEVSSEVGSGSEFRVFLPTLTGPFSSPVRRGQAVRGGHETVLVVEDEDEVRRAAVRLLEGIGYTVIEADTGETALRLMGERGAEIALVFSDIVMPGSVSGPQLASQLFESHPHVPVILTSGYSPDVMGGDAAASGGRPLRPGRNFLQKPYREAEVAAAVRAMLDGEGAGD